MASIRLAIDWIYGQASDSKLAKKVVELLCNAGHDAVYVGWGPNKIQEYMRSSSHACDIMIQIGGGKCFGTLGDFYYGTQINGYYHAKGFAFLYYNCWSETWPCHREPRDTFSWSLDLTRWEGKTLPWTFNDMKNTLGKKAYYGYGNSAEELVKTFLANLGGSSSSSTDSKDNQQSQGNSILDLIKQVLTDIDPYGAELTLTGDTVNIRKTRIDDATILDDSSIVNNTESSTDWDISTPNKYRGVEFKALSKWFGLIEISEEEIPPGDDDDLVLRLAQRGHNHSVDLKCLMNPDHMEGKWIKLTNKKLGIEDWYYYITKTSYEEDRIMSVTLEPGPPIRQIEVVEETVDEEVTDDTDTDDDSGDDT